MNTRGRNVYCLSTYFHTGMLTPVDWRCPQPKEKCSFYLWQEHEAKAKEYHKAAERSLPRTPSKANICSYLEETPSTRKRAAKDSTNSEADLTHPSEPAAKAIRRSIFSTPGQQPNDRPGGGAASLPTPDSRPHTCTGKRRAFHVHLLQSRDTSPTPVRSGDAGLKPDEDTNTFKSVLELLRDNGLNPDRSAREMLRYLITSKVFRDT